MGGAEATGEPVVTLLSLDLTAAFEAAPGIESATLRERQLIEVIASEIERLRNEIYWLRQDTSKRPEVVAR
jgi:hypothetical protein